MKYNYNENLVSVAQNLRKNMTPEEKHLWYDFFKKLPITVHRQKNIGNFIVDFYIMNVNHRYTIQLVANVDASDFQTLHNDICNRLRGLQNFTITSSVANAWVNEVGELRTYLPNGEECVLDKHQTQDSNIPLEEIELEMESL